MFCSKCGAQVEDSAVYCPSCGAKMLGVISPGFAPEQATPVPQNAFPGQQQIPQNAYSGQQQVPQNAYPGQQIPQNAYPGQPQIPQNAYPGQQIPQNMYNGQQAQPHTSYGTGKVLSVLNAVLAIIVYILMFTPLFKITVFSQDIDVTLFKSFELSDTLTYLTTYFGGYRTQDEMASTAIATWLFFISIFILLELIAGIALLIASFVKYPNSGDRFIPTHFGVIDITILLLVFVPLFINPDDNYNGVISVHSSPTMIIAAALCVICFIIEISGEIYNSNHGYVKQPVFGRTEESKAPAFSAPNQPEQHYSAPAYGRAPSASPAPSAPSKPPVEEDDDEKPAPGEWICSRCGTRNKLISDTCKRCEHKRDE